jgi:hypothetical protein
MATISRLVLLALCGAAQGCVAEPSEPPANLARGQPVTVVSERGVAELTVELEGDGIVRGSNALRVDVVSREPGALAELLAASAFMPVHGHGSESTVTPFEMGYRVDGLVLSMAGRWEIWLEVRAGAAGDRASLAVDVP